jgi:hypothetical protein
MALIDPSISETAERVAEKIARGAAGLSDDDIYIIAKARICVALMNEREACAAIADEHLARIPGHCPDKQEGDLVAHGYGNAALNIAHAIRNRS